MPASVRSKGCVGGNKATPITPMSERQQMALLMQMTSKYNDGDSRNSSGEGTSLRSKDRNERGETFLHLAAIKGDIEQVCKLLAHHADPNVKDFAGWSPLHEACNHGWYEVACRLIQAGANVNAKGLDNFTPLHDAVQNGHIKLVKLLVEKGADINAKNSKGRTPLDCALPTVAAIMMDPSLPIPEPSVSTRLQPRSRDEKKVTETPSPSTTTANKQKNSTTSEEAMDSSKSNISEDVYEFKAVKESSNSPDNKTADPLDVENDAADPLNINTPSAEESSTTKRNFSEVTESNEESTNDEESKRKKRKDDNAKETKAAVPQRNASQGKGQSNKQASSSQNKTSTTTSTKGSLDTKSPSLSPKPSTSSDAELEDGKSDLKVPPLKIVIPQGSTNEQEIGSTRNGKNSSQRSHQALPYVVPSSNNESSDKDATPSGTNSPTENTSVKSDEKKENTTGTDDQRAGHHQRVLRSSHRSGNVQGSADRSSNNSSPQLQRSHSPSPSASPSTPSNQPETSTSNNNSTALASKSSDVQVNTSNDVETSTPASNLNSSSSTSSSVELHPRKRKMKPNKEPPTASPAEPLEAPVISEIHPHEQPITNCYQLYLNIRKQIEKRRKGLFPVQPKPPQGFKDYLMNRCTYVLAGTAPTTPNVTYPSTLPAQMKDLFNEQEKERYRLRMQHVIEKEKLVLSVEQEILRVHGRAARALANQSLPFSVCTILRDEEVYNLITPEQEEKDRNARSRYNGRLFLSWLQDVDDKWEKIKEHMLLRHHNEAESLHAVQKMDWEWKLKELSLCDAKSTPSIDELHVPMVHVSDDFDLLPA